MDIGPLLLPTLVLLAVIVVGVVLFYWYFARGGQRAMVEQHDIEGRDDPPNTF